ncbi:MAG: hypothetical protein JWP44_4129 [Mucilaginibacter sp.]|nr:hypothetical protein [Mucilaginibacter sp.]
MLVSAFSRDNLILTNIIQTLQQMKQSGVANKPLVMPHTATSVTVSFYTDQQRSSLLFTDTSVANPSRFTVQGTGTFYVPPDSLLNAASGLSTTLAQATYYVTATFSDAVVQTLAYRNAANLVFQQVIVASKENPSFTGTENTAIIVPGKVDTQVRPTNTEVIYNIPNFNLYVQLNVYDWTNLSEQNRLVQYQVYGNLIRNALYTDAYRNGNATFWTKNINGTNVDSLKPLPSKDLMRGIIKVQCAYQAFGTGN